jgi:hypothetical protein
MKPTLLGIIILFAVGIAAPVIPQDMKFISAWEYQCTGVVPDYSHAIYDPTKDFPTLEPCSGTKHTAAFLDSNGNKVYLPLTQQLYQQMGQRDGVKLNPTKEEFKSVLETYVLAQPASAAVAYLTSNINNCAAATSCTYALDSGSTGSDRVLVLGFEIFKTTDTITSVTYNGTAVTRIDAQTDTGAGATIHMYAQALATTSVNNLVINMSSSDSPQIRFAVYTGMSATFPDAKNKKDVASVVAGDTITLTTVANNSWVVGVTGNSGCAGYTSGGASTVVRQSSACSVIYDSNQAITPAGATSLSINNSGGSFNIYSVIASFAPVVNSAGAGGTYRLIF